MHYKNGREAKNGDKVVLAPAYPGAVPVAGILYDATPGNDYCNGRIAITSPSDPCPNLNECLHADDIAAAEIPSRRRRFRTARRCLCLRRCRQTKAISNQFSVISQNQTSLRNKPN